MIEILSGTWAAGEVKTFMVSGEYFEILDAQYPCDVYLMDKAGAQLSTMKGAEASFFTKPSPGFNTVQVYSQQAQALRFFVGSGDAGTRRISSTVQVVDGNVARSKAGAAFLMRMTSGGNATDAAVAMLWNPAGTGKRAVIDALQVSTNIAGAIIMGFVAAANGISDPARLRSTLGGGTPVSVMEARYYTMPFAQVFDYAGATYAAANLAINVDLKRPLVLLPGQGFIIRTDNQANAAITGIAQFYEETI